MIDEDLVTDCFVKAGHMVGPFQPMVILKAFDIYTDVVLAELQQVIDRYPRRPTEIRPSLGDELLRQSRTVAENCKRAVEEKLKGGE